jgi:hypothetical protein
LRLPWALKEMSVLNVATDTDGEKPLLECRKIRGCKALSDTRQPIRRDRPKKSPKSTRGSTMQNEPNRPAAFIATNAGPLTAGGK